MFRTLVQSAEAAGALILAICGDEKEFSPWIKSSTQQKRDKSAVSLPPGAKVSNGLDTPAAPFAMARWHDGVLGNRDLKCDLLRLVGAFVSSVPMLHAPSCLLFVHELMLLFVLFVFAPLLPSSGLSD